MNDSVFELNSLNSLIYLINYILNYFVKRINILIFVKQLITTKTKKICQHLQ